MHTFVTPSYTLHISTHSFIYVAQTYRHTSSHALHVTASCMLKISTHPPTHYVHKPTNTQRVKCACGHVSTYIIYAIHIDTLYMLCWVFAGVCPFCVGGCVDMYIGTYLIYATHIYIHINIHVVQITHIIGSIHMPTNTQGMYLQTRRALIGLPALCKRLLVQTLCVGR